jgi:hypothetical protein
MNSHGKLLAICIFVLYPSLSFADDLKLRAMDTHGKPLSGNIVHVTFSYQNEQTQRLELKTNVDGAASFSVSDPVPTRVSVNIVPNAMQHWRCTWHGTCGISVTPDEALRSGVAFYESKERAKLRTNPGEILFVARGWTFWQHLLAPITE